MTINMMEYPCPNCMEIKTTAGCGCNRRWFIQNGPYFSNDDLKFQELEDRIQKLEKEVQRLKEKE